jgi:hypothetical protein
MSTSREKLFEAGAKAGSTMCSKVTVQRAEVAIPSLLFAEILDLNDWLRLAPLPTRRASIY